MAPGLRVAGDPGAAQYQHMSDQLTTIDFKDTFLDPGEGRWEAGVESSSSSPCVLWRLSMLLTSVPWVPLRSSSTISDGPCLRPFADHLRECFPGYKVEFVNKSRSETLQRPFRITFPPPAQPADASEGGEAGSKKKKRKAGADDAPAGQGSGGEAAVEPPTLLVESYTPTDPGPYPQDQPPQVGQQAESAEEEEEEVPNTAGRIQTAGNTVRINQHPLRPCLLPP